MADRSLICEEYVELVKAMSNYEFFNNLKVVRRSFERYLI